MYLLSLRIVFPYFFPNNSGAGVISSRLSICSEWDPRFQLGRRIRTHLLKLSPVPGPQLAQESDFLKFMQYHLSQSLFVPLLFRFLISLSSQRQIPMKGGKTTKKFHLLTLPPLRRCSLASHQGVTLWIIKVQNFHRCQKIPYLSWQKHASLLFVLNKASVNHCSA